LNDQGFVWVKEAAEILGVCPNTIRSWGAQGKLTEYRHPINNNRLFKRSDLKKVLQNLEHSIENSA